MKKRLAVLLAGALALSGAMVVNAEGVELNVTTTYAGEDGNAQNFRLLSLSASQSGLSSITTTLMIVIRVFPSAVTTS